jgi:hypothetical protein
MTDQQAQIDARFTATRIAGWVRWASGIVVAVLISLIIMTTTLRDYQVQDCQRSSRDRANEAKSWMAVHDREVLLATISKSAQEADAHSRSAIEAVITADGLRIHTAPTAKLRKARCERLIPHPIPFVS